MSDAVEQTRWIRYLIETYTTPQQFQTPTEYLAALTEVLDELVSARGAEPPVLEGVWS